MIPGVLTFLDADVGPDIYMGFQVFRAIPVFIIIIAGLIGIVKIKQGNVYLYILVSVAIVLLSLIPYTGPLLGYIIGARMLFRASWFAPFGLGVVRTGKVCADIIKQAFRICQKVILIAGWKNPLRGYIHDCPCWDLLFLLWWDWEAHQRGAL